MVGIVIGWSWKPEWSRFVLLGTRSNFRFVWNAPPSFGSGHVSSVLATSLTFPLLRKHWDSFRARKAKAEQTTDKATGADQEIVNFKDLETLWLLLENKDGGPEWQMMMEHSTSKMTYQAWRRESKIGPTQYRTRTVFEDSEPELVRDFFWDDDFRQNWDDMLKYYKVLVEYPLTGTMIVHWIRKFPYFYSDREYIIGRRIWELEGTYFCTTKGVPYSSVQRNNRRWRVDTYYSSWRIQAVKSIKGDGQLTASEVILFHYEDIGIPKVFVNFAVHHGMWPHVQKICDGLYAYKMKQMSGTSLSLSASMARINTKIPTHCLGTLGLSLDKEVVQSWSNTPRVNRWKWIIVVGVVVLACGIDRGVFCKALVFGVARRLRHPKKKIQT